MTPAFTDPAHPADAMKSSRPIYDFWTDFMWSTISNLYEV
jgi:hypothetical protein